MTELPPRTRTRFGAAAVLVSYLLIAPATLASQAAPAAEAARVGKIVGRVIDTETGAGITEAGVQVVGTTLGASSGVDGRYAIANVPAGTITIQVRRIGFQPKTVTGLLLESGQTLVQDVSLGGAAVQLTATVVTASAERGTVAEALDQQRTATGIVSAVTAEQIARSPDSDAAQAVQRVSGVTVQDGRSVQVRGLGERYTTASLNGARLPSPDPEKRMVPLDLFPSGLLQSVTTSKTFTPDLPGDFSGAHVDIQTREFPARRVVTMSTSVGGNDAAVGRTVLASPNVGGEWLAAASGARSLPGALSGNRNLIGFSQQQYNSAMRSFRNAWDAQRTTGLPSSSFGVSVGGQDPLLGLNIGYLVSGTYAFSQEVRSDEYHANPNLEAGGRTVVQEYWNGSTGRQSVLWGGIANVSAMVGGRTRAALNNTYSRTADNEAREDVGPSFDFGQREIRRTTLRYIERSIRSNQLAVQHAFGTRHALDWSLTSSGVTRDEPDRSDLVYVKFDRQDGAGSYFGYQEGSPEVSRRTFGELDEHSAIAGANYRLTLGEAGAGTVIKVGGQFRSTTRDAVNAQYRLLTLPSAVMSEDVRSLTAEQIFDGRFAADESETFTIAPITTGGSYGADDRLAAGYGMVDLPAGSRVRVIAGARVEDVRLRVATELLEGGVVTAPLNDTDVLPSLVINTKLGETQSLRVSASQTLARPEYRELSPSFYYDVVGGSIVKGNPALVRSLIQNYDVRWENYPDAGELVSVALFAKRFQDPIERVDQATGGPMFITFANARSAMNYGVELEARKGLGSLLSALSPYSLFSNVTLMRSNIDIGSDAVAGITNSDRPMVGQAPYVVNVGGTYLRASGASATLLYNVVGQRIYAAGTGELDDIYERPRHVLEVSLRFGAPFGLAAKIDARNLLDAPYELTQGEITRERYRSGRTLSVGLSWRH